MYEYGEASGRQGEVREVRQVPVRRANCGTCGSAYVQPYQCWRLGSARYHEWCPWHIYGPSRRDERCCCLVVSMKWWEEGIDGRGRREEEEKSEKEAVKEASGRDLGG